MFCNQCGQANSNDAKFCSGCGSSLKNQNIQHIFTQQIQDQAKPSQTNTQLSPLRHAWLFFLFVISLIMILGIFPYQVISGNFELTYIFTLFLWFWVLQYTYPKIFSKKSNAKAFNAFDEAKIWFDRQGIIKTSINFNSYTDKYLAKTHGEVTILVGIGNKVNGEHVGFAIEVKEGQGVVESAIIEPAGIASQDKKAILLANEKGKSLIDALQELALNHRLNNIK